MGSVNLDNTGSGSGVVLSSDGTSLLLDGTAIGGGGGGAALYDANEDTPTSQPSATGSNAIAIGDGAVAAGEDGLSFGIASKARAATSVGIFGDAQSVGSVSIGQGSAVSANYGVALGFSGFATAVSAMALGKSRASGTDSFAAAIGNNTATYGAQGQNNIAMGSLAKTAGNWSTSIGYQAVASDNGAVAIGLFNETTGRNALSMGSFSHATQHSSVAIGFGAGSDVIGKQANTGGRINNTTGSSQQGTFVLFASTTNTTQKQLTTNGGTIGTNRNRMFIGPNTAYAFTGMVVAREEGVTGDLAAAWEVKGLYKTSSGGTPTLVTKVINIIDNTPSWGFDIAIDGYSTSVLDFLVTGQALKNISWVATITTTELINP